MNNRKFTDLAATSLLWLAGIFILGLLAILLIYILYKGLPVLNWNFITGPSSDIRGG